MTNWRLRLIWIYALIGPVIIGGVLAVIIGSVVYTAITDWDTVVGLLTVSLTNLIRCGVGYFVCDLLSITIT